jgi:hypothetical protein
MKLTKIDLNAELGETVNDYLDLLPIITPVTACAVICRGLSIWSLEESRRVS